MITEDGANDKIVRVTRARKLGLPEVAEGIETTTQLQLLSDRTTAFLARVPVDGYVGF